jgi:CDGSH-type Zn-finger protein/uncharacterized Fe-S cluster protein YjdI
MPKPRSYSGTDIEISFDMSRCIHARNCFLALPQVFDPARKPWVDPDGAPAEDVAAMIRTCPSGALQFRRLDGGVEEAPRAINRVQLRENGPVEISGDLRLNGETHTRLTLCRCGASANKPFCDAAHGAAGFVATGEPEATGKDSGEDRPGEVLEIRPVPHGPLGLVGPVEVTTGSGARLARAEKVFLCRCGASKNKPFCDGSHKDAGFQAPGD